MSAIASFIKLPEAAAEQLRTDYDGCIEVQGQEVADYQWSGYVLATLLVYLQGRGIDLMQSPHKGLASDLAKTRGTTVFIFTSAHGNAYLARLSPDQFSVDELRDYFNNFNGCNEPEMGQAMLDGIDSIHQSLASLDGGSILLLEIG